MTTETAETLAYESSLPGTILMDEREKKGLDTEYVAGKLHLRVKVIELLEADDYANLPEPVFVKGYIRAYAKLLDIDPNPLLEKFSATVKTENRQERTLWQGQREHRSGVHMLRWVTLASFVVVVVAVGIWWHKAKDVLHEDKTPAALQLSEKRAKSVSLTDLNKMRTVELPKKGEKSGG